MKTEKFLDSLSTKIFIIVLSIVTGSTIGINLKINSSEKSIKNKIEQVKKEVRISCR